MLNLTYMKKLFCLLSLALLLFATQLQAAERNHLLTVTRTTWWAPDYLVVIWNGSIGCTSKDTRDYVRKLLVEPDAADQDDFFRPTQPLITIGSVVKAVDGVDAKRWSVDQFYAVIDRPGTHRLTLWHPLAENEYEVVFNGTMPAWMTAQGFHPLTCVWKNVHRPGGPVLAGYKSSDAASTTNVRVDNNVDWTKFKTFDYIVQTNDVLAEKELLNKIAENFMKVGMRWVPDNPDIVFSIVKDASQSIDYTYVPKTEQQVMTGSNSKAVYGWKGAYLGSVTTNNYQTVTSGGYTQKTAQTQAYLEVNVLETSRIGEKVAPLIWQMKYNYNYNVQGDVDGILNKAASSVTHPVMLLRETKDSETATRWFYDNISMINVGVILDGATQVIGLDGNSSLVKSSGLRIGDYLKGVNVVRTKSLSNSGPSVYYKGSLTVLRNGQTMTLEFDKVRPVNSYKPMSYYASYTRF